MKATLVYCDTGKGVQPPLGIAYVASYVRKYGGHKIEILDLGAGDKIRRLDSPDYIGITSTTTMFPESRRTIKALKEIHPDVPVIIGGVHVTALPETIKDDLFDIGVIGEGEKTMLEILDGKPLEEIQGIVFKKDGKIIQNPPRPLIQDLDSTPFPARDLLRMEEYYIKPKQVIRGVLRRSTQIMSSRGCPYNCIFCGSCVMWHRKVRAYSPDYVISELHELIDKYRVEAVYFQDDMLSFDKKRLHEICSRMKEEGITDKIIWSCQLRANLTSKEVIDEIKGAGCIQAEFGFESGSEKTLKNLKGGSVTVEDNRKAVELCNSAGIRILGNFLIGSPGETRKDIAESMDFIRKNRMDFVHLHILTPFPGTDLWELVKDKPEAYEWENFSMSNTDENMIVADKLSRKELMELYAEMKKEIDGINYSRMEFRLSDVLEPSVLKRALAHPVRTLKRAASIIASKMMRKQ